MTDSAAETLDTVTQAAGSGARSFVPQTMLDAADGKIATWSTAIVDTADTIERLVSAESLPIPGGLRDLASATTQKLRNFGTAAGETEAADLVDNLQKVAAAHPAASIGLGAAIGTALATLLVRLGRPDDDATPTPARAPSGGRARQR